MLGRSFAYADAHRYRVGANHNQIPVNAPRCPVRSYSKDGQMRFVNSTDPVYAPNSYGGPKADPDRASVVKWAVDGGMMVRASYTLRPDDDDWGQAGALVRDVMDDAERERLVHNIVHHVTDGVKEPVLSRVVEYWYNIDADIGKRVEDGIRAANLGR